MIGDVIILKERHKRLAARVLDHIDDRLQAQSIISIAGESGSGKSTMAMSLKELLEQQSYHVVILHMDDYYLLPPTDNHNARLADLAHVGPQEVNLGLLQQHLDDYKAGAKLIDKPLVHFRENEIRSEVLTLEEPSILIIEGTYVTLLRDVDVRVFMTRDYHQSYKDRLARGRDQGTAFIEKVLSLEHEIVKQHATKADLLVDAHYRITTNNIDRDWWKSSVMYQIYPRSYQDSNGDGFGDIPGIISRLDHIEDLGIDIIWLSPVYPSPDHDYGYDISDYYGIDPRYGDLTDFKNLLDDVHSRGMKLIMDLVVNHTSIDHDWFKHSRSSVDSPYRDYYIWRENVDGTPPTNWQAWFGGPAWTLDETTDCWYLHLFTPQQPDLNWENPKVRKEVYENMRYWLDMGVDGFRMDVISLLSKPAVYRDSPNTAITYLAEHFYANGPRIHEFLREMHDQVLSLYDVVTVGEGPGITKEVALDYIGSDRRELNMIFQLDLMFGDHGPGGKFDIRPMSLLKLKQIMDSWDAAVATGGWNNVFLDNHDFPRMVSRFGDDGEYRDRSAKMLATMILSMRGTPCIYQGSEIGMTNVAFDDPTMYRDVEAVNFFASLDEWGIDTDEALRRMHIQGRDNARTPMQWSSSDHGGFSDVAPWISVNPNYKHINVAAETAKEDGILAYYKQLINLRKVMSIFVYGDYISLTPEHEQLYCYSREMDDERIFVVLNFSGQAVPVPSYIHLGDTSVLISNVDAPATSMLQAWEGTIWRQRS